MAGKDYYVVLGVSRTETMAGIRAAYRARAKQLREDRGDEQVSPAFPEIHEAYQVLSDAGRRRTQDLNLRAAQERAAGPLPPGASEREAVLPPDRPAVTLLADPEGIHPSFESLHERLLRNFTGIGVPKSERIEGLNMDLVLTTEEATHGLALRVRVPTVHSCPACGGSGIDWAFPCALCERQGVVQEDDVVPVHIPPGSRTGTVVEVPLEDLGVHNLVLRFHVSVSAARDPIPFG
jgi:molecular chaperone DnaJ